MKKNIKIDDREKKLEHEINDRFEHLGPSELDELGENFERTLMEMFHVSKIEHDHVELTHLFNDEIYTPVHVDENVRELLHKNDTFLMTLGFKQNAWHVLYMSPPYDTWTC